MRHASKNCMPGSGTVCMMAPDRQCLITGAKGSWDEQAGPNHAITPCQWHTPIPLVPRYAGQAKSICAEYHMPFAPCVLTAVCGFGHSGFYWLWQAPVWAGGKQHVLDRQFFGVDWTRWPMVGGFDLPRSLHGRFSMTALPHLIAPPEVHLAEAFANCRHRGTLRRWYEHVLPIPASCQSCLAYPGIIQ